MNGELVDWTYSRVRAVWYRDERVRVRSAEVEQLRLIVKAGPKDTDDLQELRQRVARLERLLETSDEAFHSPTLAALRNQGGEVG